MFRQVKRFTVFLLMITMICGAVAAVSAETFVTLDGYSFYTDQNGEAVIVGYDDSSPCAEIPDSLLSAKVTEIANNAFFGDAELEEVVFENATGLRRIGSNAFCNCTSINSVTIPDLDEMGFGVFQGCTELKALTVDEGLTTIPMQAFYDCGKLEDITLPASVTTIEEYAFANCGSLKELEIPRTVTDISDTAFYNCDQLVILCYTDSAAHLYAQKQGIPFELLDKKKDIADATITPEATAVGYNGKEHYPSVTVTYDGIVLQNDIDYTITYDNNTDVGTASIHVIGCGNYEGDLYAAFAIKNVLGDADGNGYVEVVDVTLIQRRLAGIDVLNPERVDYVGNVTRDGKLSIIDATFIQRWIADIEIPYEVNILMY